LIDVAKINPSTDWHMLKTKLSMPIVLPPVDIMKLVSI